MASPRPYRIGVTDSGPIYLPGDMTDDEAAQAVAAYNKAIAAQTALLQQTSGVQRRQIEAQIEDLKRGRDNAMEIARLQAQTSRYGTDQQTQTRMAELRQNQAQFDQTHALDLQRFGLDTQRFGLDVAKAYTDYAATPDLTFQRGDLMEGLERAGVGLGMSPYGSTGTPQQKTWADFAALSGFSTPAVQANQSTQQAGAGAPGAPSGGQGEGQQDKDPRVGAAMGILKALPMSEGDGLDQSDFAALNAVRNVISARRPGTLQKFRPGQRSAFFSGAKKLGYYAPDLEADMIRSGIGQRSSRLA